MTTFAPYVAHVLFLERINSATEITRATCRCGWAGMWTLLPEDARREFTHHFNDRRTA